MNRSPLRISAPEDLLALVPCVLGFHPDDSLVLVVLAGEGGNVHARVDLTLDDDGVRAGVAGLMTAVRRTEARLVGVIAYTDDPVLADDALDLLFDQLIDTDVDWAFAIRADGERWFNLDCDDVCCPPTGEPYDISAHPITAQFVLDGHVTFSSRADLADSLTGTDVDDVEAVQAAADEALRRFRSVASGPLGAAQPGAARRHLVAEGHWVRARVRHFLASREPLDVDDAGRMAVALVNVEVRDVAWAQMTRDNAEVHVELWRGLVRRTPPDLLAAPAALLGFAAWLSGDGALAWCAVERCQQAEPGYSMADLLTRALIAAVPPTAWTPIPGDELPLFAG